MNLTRGISPEDADHLIAATQQRADELAQGLEGVRARVRGCVRRMESGWRTGSGRSERAHEALHMQKKHTRATAAEICCIQYKIGPEAIAGPATPTAFDRFSSAPQRVRDTQRSMSSLPPPPRRPTPSRAPSYLSFVPRRSPAALRMSYDNLVALANAQERLRGAVWRDRGEPLKELKSLEECLVHAGRGALRELWRRDGR
jgi:hypothetical protein